MNDDTKPTDAPQLPAIQGRIIAAAVEIAEAPPLEIVYQHSLFCQVALPRSRPEGRIFERSYRNGLIRMDAGALWDGRKMVDQPLPAGPKPRLVLMHINSQAVKTRSPYIDLGRSCAEFLRRLGLDDQSGSTYKLFKREMQALAACRMTLGFNEGDKPVTVNAQPITRFEAWFSANDDAPALWPSELQLGHEYFESLQKHAVPLDPRAVGGLAHSAHALDIYSFLARRLHTLQKPVKVTWHQFHEQFGQEYQDWRSFKKRFIPAVRAALALYPSAKVEEVTGGLRLHPSLPPVHHASVAVSHGLAAQVRKALPAPTTKNLLRTATIEQFRTLYPRLDPYACKDDFDTWLDGKEPPRVYDRAFLGFAKKWTKGKV
jgi:Plasmid encoded RepA protein